MVNKWIQVFLGFGLCLGISGSGDDSFEGASGGLEQLQILLLLVDSFDLPLEVLLQSKVVCPQPVVLLLDFHVELDLLIRIPVSSSQLLVLSSKHIQLGF